MLNPGKSSNVDWLYASSLISCSVSVPLLTLNSIPAPENAKSLALPSMTNATGLAPDVNPSSALIVVGLAATVLSIACPVTVVARSVVVPLVTSKPFEKLVLGVTVKSPDVVVIELVTTLPVKLAPVIPPVTARLVNVPTLVMFA